MRDNCEDDISGLEPDDENGLTLTIAAGADAPRMDVFLAESFPYLSRSHILKLIRGGGATINGETRKPSASVRAGDSVVLELPPLRPSDLTPENIPLDVLYEDDSLIVVNKQKGLPAHPAPSCPEGTLVNALLYRFAGSLSGIGGEIRPGIVHRLDKDTSGVMLVARNNLAHEALAEQFNSRTIEKHYSAIVHGRMESASGVVIGPIGRDPHNRKRMKVVSRGGKDAETAWSTERRFAHFSVVDAHPFTGRTHQVRVHMAHIGHPLAGDGYYGGAKVKTNLKPDSQERKDLQDALDGLNGQALHARSITFNHPKSGDRLSFEAPLPADMAAFLEFLENHE